MDTRESVRMLNALASANKEIRDERFRDKDNSIADFEGIVKGVWQSLNDDGSGTVLYKTKEYRVIPEGRTSIPAGTKVDISFRRGYYVADWS